MATQNSQLIENLNLIYNEKLAQKTVLETTSDDFLLYHTYIAALKPVGYTTISQNGEVNVSSYKFAYVSVPGGGINPAGSYNITTNGEYDIYNYATAVVEVDSSIPEGYLLPSGNIDLIQNGMVDVKEYAYATVVMPVPTGTVNITENGTAIDVSQYASANVAVPVPSGYVLPSGILEINSNVIAQDVSTYAYVTVDVEGGGSGGGDPYNDATWIDEVIHDELFEENIEYLSIYLSDNYEATLTSEEGESTEYTIEFDSITNIDGNNVTIHVIANGAQYNPLETIEENYSSHMQDVYDENITVILEYAMVTESEDPSNDGYDYLAEGTFKYFGLETWNDNVIPITENGFYVSPVPQAFSVDVTPSAGEGTYYIFNNLGQLNPSNYPNNMALDLSDYSNYASLEIINLHEINYMDQTSEQTHYDYYTFAITYSSSINNYTPTVVTSSNGEGLADGNDYNYDILRLNSNILPDYDDDIVTLYGYCYTWIDDIDPETGTDNGYYDVSFNVAGSIESGELSYTGDFDIYVNQFGYIFQNGELICQVELE